MHKEFKDANSIMQKKADMNKYLLIWFTHITYMYDIYIYILCLYTKQPQLSSPFGWNPQQKVAFTTQQLLIKTHVIVPLQGPWTGQAACRKKKTVHKKTWKKNLRIQVCS